MNIKPTDMKNRIVNRNVFIETPATKYLGFNKGTDKELEDADVIVGKIKGIDYKYVSFDHSGDVFLNIE